MSRVRQLSYCLDCRQGQVWPGRGEAESGAGGMLVTEILGESSRLSLFLALCPACPDSPLNSSAQDAGQTGIETVEKILYYLLYRKNKDFKKYFPNKYKFMNY